VAEITTARWSTGVLLAGLLVSAVPACASQTTSSASVSAAENGYGSQSTVMFHALLRAGACGQEGSRLSIQASTRAGVAFTNYTPAGGLVVGVRDQADVSQVEQWLRSQPAVLSVEQVPRPSGPPASAAKAVPAC
jgi:hypothetical protein